MDELAQLNAALKANRISKADFARQCDKSYSWMLIVLRGDFPYCGARAVPVNIYRVAVRLGLLDTQSMTA